MESRTGRLLHHTENKYDDDEKATRKRRIILYLLSTGNGSDDAIVDATHSDWTRLEPTKCNPPFGQSPIISFAIIFIAEKAIVQLFLSFTIGKDRSRHQFYSWQRPEQHTNNKNEKKWERERERDDKTIRNRHLRPKPKLETKRRSISTLQQVTVRLPSPFPFRRHRK